MFPMALVYVVGVLLIIGLLLWGLKALPYIDDGAKLFIRVLIIVATGVWLIYLLMGVLGGASPRAWPLGR